MCCWPECDGESVDETVPLCLRHHMKAWRTFEKMAMWPLEQLRREFAGIEERAATAPRPNRNTVSSVYFIRLGSRVKIGFSTNVRSRLADLPHEQVLGVIPGTFADENRLHKQFAHLRTTGEWFRAEPELLEFIAKNAKPYVPPTRGSAPPA